jgi:hypothetical protein
MALSNNAPLSPYHGLPVTEWLRKTQELIASHPLKEEEMVSVVLACWEDLFKSKIGSKPLLIGKHYFPTPQITGLWLEQLITSALADKYPKLWCGVLNDGDKDLVCMSDVSKSVEIKTSSSARHIYGNRSYAQKATGEKQRISKKDKNGYYLTVNFEKIERDNPKGKVKLVRFGWLDHDDWTGQAAATGQQASISDNADRYKLIRLYPE